MAWVEVGDAAAVAAQHRDQPVLGVQPLGPGVDGRGGVGRVGEGERVEGGEVAAGRLRVEVGAADEAGAEDVMGGGDAAGDAVVAVDDLDAGGRVGVAVHGHPVRPSTAGAGWASCWAASDVGVVVGNPDAGDGQPGGLGEVGQPVGPG